MKPGIVFSLEYLEDLDRILLDLGELVMLFLSGVDPIRIFQDLAETSGICQIVRIATNLAKITKTDGISNINWYFP